MTRRLVSARIADDRLHLCAESLARCHSDAPMTIDGEPATISGAFLRFASVRRRDGKGGDVTYSWEAAARIVARGGQFIS